MSSYKAKRSTSQKHPKRRLDFQACVARTSSRFIRTRDLDEAIQASLAEVGQLSGASRAYLFLLHEDGTALDNTHEWCAEGVSPQITNLQNLPAEIFPWWMKRLRVGEVIHIPDVSKMPRKAAAERQILESQDIKSILVLPVSSGEKLLGFIGFDNVSTTGAWSQTDLAILQMLSETIGAALDRKQVEEALQKSKEQYRLLAENLHDVVVSFSLDGRLIYCTPNVAEFGGYDPLEEIGNPLDKYVAIKEDIPRIYGVIAEMMTTKKPAVTEFLYQPKNREPFPVEVTTRPVIEAGEITKLNCVVRDISARKRVEQALRESEERHRILFTSSRDAIMTLEPPAWKFTSANPATLKLFDTRTEAEFISLGPWDLSPEHQPNGELSSSKARRMIEKAMRKGSNFFQWTHKKKDGKEFPATVLLTRVELDNRAFLQATVRDITEFKQAQAALQYRLEFEGLIATLSTDFIHSAHEEIDSKINTALRAMGEFVGVDRSYVSLFDSDPTRMSITHEWRSEGIEPQIQHLQHVDIQPLAWSMEKLRQLAPVHIPRVAGLPAEATVERELFESQGIRSLVLVPMAYGQSLMGFIGFDSVRAERTWSDENIALLRMVGEMFMNALVRKQAEEKVIRRNRELAMLNAIAQTITQSLDLGEILDKALHKIMEMLEIKYTGVYLLDEKAESLNLTVHHGVSDEMAGTVTPISLNDLRLTPLAQPLFIPCLARLVPTLPGPMARMITENQIESIMLLPLTARGHVLGVMFAATQHQRVFTTNERDLLTTVAHQVSTAIENMQLLKEASRAIALEETDRLRTAFLASVSHELRTPLTCIKGLASSLILPDVEWDAETQKDFLTTIDRESDRLTRVVNDVLDMSKIEIGAMRLSKASVRIDLIIEGLRSILTSFTLNHDLQFRVAHDLPPILADTVRIKQAIANLLENAVAHSPKGSAIILEARPSEGDIMVSVSDQGEGVLPEDLDRIFSPFYRIEENTERRRSGVGLGLSICKGIIESHGGRIWAESAGPGKGLTVRFTLPVEK
ncbi:MAG: GAF domain-containing protein [Chloroflexi bacterium]|nr:GAF domain-containing protein [Chloroflexota bacterium]